MKNEWAKIEHYRDKERREIIVFRPFDKQQKKPLIRGMAVLVMRGINPQTRQPVQQEKNFEFAFDDGTTLKEAMESFDEVAHIAVKEFEKKQTEKQKRIVAARTMPPLLGPGGKPIQRGD